MHVRRLARPHLFIQYRRPRRGRLLQVRAELCTELLHLLVDLRERGVHGRVAVPARVQDVGQLRFVVKHRGSPVRKSWSRLECVWTGCAVGQDPRISP